VIFVNGVIYTGEGLDRDTPQTVEAMAVGGGRVLAVGTTVEIKQMAGPKTTVRDLKGTVVFPGFNDAHTHLGSAGQTKLNVDLTGVPSLEAMQKSVQGYAVKAEPGHWLTGGNWDHTLWADKELPTRQDLDKVTGGETGRHPAFLERIDGHIAIANSAALKAAGITGKTVAPQGGAIDLDGHGEPTGILRESAKGLVTKVIPRPSVEDRRRGAEMVMADALSHGVTSVQDFSDWQDFLVFEEMKKEGKLHLRISEWLPFKLPVERLVEMRAHHDANDEMLHTGMLKGFMDGSLGSRTAAMKAPYADDPGNTGLPQYKQDELNRMAQERAQAGFQLGFHAIGDKANAMALEALSYAKGVGNNTTCRLFGQKPRPMDEKMNCPWLQHRGRDRIEHAQVVDQGEIMNFRLEGVIASMQPNHLLTDMNWAEARLGEKRAGYSYAWKAFLGAGVHLAFGTDYPVEPVTPFRGLYAAVTRKNEAGTKEYYPENKITRGQALFAYTQGSAYAEFAESRKGKLAQGYDADFILVDRDLYTVDAPEILKTVVKETWVAGQLAAKQE
jgi:predicted amidohydrolase YtcJ